MYFMCTARSNSKQYLISSFLFRFFFFAGAGKCVRVVCTHAEYIVHVRLISETLQNKWVSEKKTRKYT